jgi:hypothetical protein
MRTRKQRAQEVQKRTFMPGDIAGEVKTEEVTAEFLVQTLIAPYVVRAPSESFADAPASDVDAQIAQLYDMAREADKATVERVGSVLAGTPAVAPDTGFASNNAAFQAATRPTAPAATVPNSTPGTVSKGLSCPMSPLAKSLLEAGEPALRRAEIRAAAEAEINAAVTKSIAAEAQKRVAKAAGKPPLNVRIVSKSS